MKRQPVWKALCLGLALLLMVLPFAGCNSSTPGSEPQDSAESAESAQEPSAEQAAASDSGYPTKDITVVVPWNPGGGTDLTVRALVEEMSGTLGKRLTVNNMPGAAGSVGTQDVFDSPRDGYKILGHGMMAFVNSQVMGLTDVSYSEWTVWDAAFSPNVIVVRKDSPYQTIDALVEAMKANPGGITCGSAGVGSGGHVGATVFAEGVGATYEHIPYDGGNPAIVATLGGEVDFNVQLSMEMIDMIRSGDLIALASLNDTDMVIEGADGPITIPSIKNYAPDMEPLLPVGESFGILVPNDTEGDIIDTIENAYLQAVDSDAFQTLADEKGMIIFGYDRVETAEYLDKLASIVCWTLYDNDSAKISPDTVGIPRL